MAAINTEGHWYTIANARNHSDYRSCPEQSPTSVYRKLLEKISTSYHHRLPYSKIIGSNIQRFGIVWFNVTQNLNTIINIVALLYLCNNNKSSINHIP